MSVSGGGSRRSRRCPTLVAGALAVLEDTLDVATPQAIIMHFAATRTKTADRARGVRGRALMAWAEEVATRVREEGFTWVTASHVCDCVGLTIGMDMSVGTIAGRAKKGTFMRLSAGHTTSNEPSYGDGAAVEGNGGGSRMVLEDGQLVEADGRRQQSTLSYEPGLSEVQHFQRGVEVWVAIWTALTGDPTCLLVRDAATVRDTVRRLTRMVPTVLHTSALLPFLFKWTAGVLGDQHDFVVALGDGHLRAAASEGSELFSAARVDSPDSSTSVLWKRTFRELKQRLDQRLLLAASTIGQRQSGGGDGGSGRVGAEETGGRANPKTPKAGAKSKQLFKGGRGKMLTAAEAAARGCNTHKGKYAHGRRVICFKRDGKELCSLLQHIYKYPAAHGGGKLQCPSGAGCKRVHELMTDAELAAYEGGFFKDYHWVAPTGR